MPTQARTRTLTLAALALAAPAAALPFTSLPAQADAVPASYTLVGDAAGSRFEGIGVSADQRTFYVSETTGGEIHRGSTVTGATEEWLPEGADGRTTARGVTTDAEGRVYVAGGPNGIGTGRPDLWVYAPDGTLLAALRVGVDNAFLNDVVIGPDGAAYFTNSNAPQVFRVAFEDGAWGSTVWSDATGAIATATGFNLGGIVVSPDGSALVVAQGNVGRLWRFDLATGAATQVATDAPLVNADGLVSRGDQLYVVRNFSRALTTLTLADDGSSAELIDDRATPADRVLTTAKLAHGRLLLVDSKFDEPVASGPYEVITMRVPR